MSDPRQPVGEELTEGEQKLLDKLLSNWLLIPDAFKVAAADYVSQNSLLPIGQVQGFTQFIVKNDVIATSEDRSWANAYADLATVGPQLSDLSRGKYLVMFGCQLLTGEASVEAFMSIDINGAGATDANGLRFQSSSLGIEIPLMRAIVLDLTESTNSIVCKYKRIGNGATVATFFARWLIALRIENL